MLPTWAKKRLASLKASRLISHPDGRLGIEREDGTTIWFQVEKKSRLSEEAAKRFTLSLPSHTGSSTLILTSALTPASREVLRERGVSWIERDTGVCHLEAPGLLIDVIRSDAIGLRPRKEDRTGGGRASRLQGKSGVLAETLLLDFQSGRLSDEQRMAWDLHQAFKRKHIAPHQNAVVITSRLIDAFIAEEENKSGS